VSLLAWLFWLFSVHPGVASMPRGQPAPLYRISHYCSCRSCTGPGGPKRTAYGHWPREGRTVAADPRLHPQGSYVTIEGLGRFRVEDTGSAIKGRRLDVYMQNHERARRAGVLWRRVR
jgi:3D (Asp-Asp-Asp) domain-containing protein